MRGNEAIANAAKNWAANDEAEVAVNFECGDWAVNLCREDNGVFGGTLRQIGDFDNQQPRTKKCGDCLARRDVEGSTPDELKAAITKAQREILNDEIADEERERLDDEQAVATN